MTSLAPPPLQESVAESERTRYRELMDVIGWFFFDLFLLGFVEDPTTGQSFRLPGGLQWAVFIEVRPHPLDTPICTTIEYNLFYIKPP